MDTPYGSEIHPLNHSLPIKLEYQEFIALYKLELS